MTQPNKLEVTQEAREAAAEYIDGELAYSSSRARIIRKGECDNDSTVQAFQRAMNQAAADEREACAKVADGLAEFCADKAPHIEPQLTNMEAWDRVRDAAEDIADAIRERTT